MIRDYINISKRFPLIILTLGFAYGATIVFTFFGPILSLTAGENALLLSIVAVSFHVLGFYLKPIKLEIHPKYFYFLLVALLPLIICFQWMSLSLQMISVILYAFMIGRIGGFWTRTVYVVIPNTMRGRIVSASLFISFIILYFVNMSISIMNRTVILYIPALMCMLSVFFYYKMIKTYNDKNEIFEKKEKKVKYPFFIFIFLIVIYISGGFSYAGIYPHLESYGHIDRYYNVLFYIISIIFAGDILDKHGRKAAFMLGVGFLGISYTFFMMPLTLGTFFVIQTFLQMGWAFVNAFGWSFSWDIAKEADVTTIFPRGIAAMLIGAAGGAFLASVFKDLNISYSIYGLVTFIPLFIAIVFLVYFPETLKSENIKIEIEKLKDIQELQLLTPRELEVCFHMINDLNNEEIGKVLFISQNTVKSHIRNIYSKLYVSSRSELKKIIKDKIGKMI